MMSVLLSSMKWLLQGHQVARLLGLFLLVTAGLKIHGLVVDPYGQENFLALPWLQVLTIEVEVLLGLWLLSGVQLRWAFVASLLLFCVFACLSFTLAWQGQTDCGCFGTVKVNPWVTFGLDVAIAGVIVACNAFYTWSANAYGDTSFAKLLINSMQVAAIASGFLFVMSLGATLYYGDLWTALAQLRGESIGVIPAVTNLGDGVAGEYRTFTISLHNFGDKPIRVVGGTTSCSCIATQSLPATVEAGSSTDIVVTMRFSGSTGKFAHRFVLYSDSQTVQTVARFSGNIVDANRTSKASVQEQTKLQLPGVQSIAFGDFRRMEK